MTEGEQRRLAAVGAVLIAAHRRLLAKAKMKVRDVEGVTDDRCSTGGIPDAELNDSA